MSKYGHVCEVIIHDKLKLVSNKEVLTGHSVVAKKIAEKAYMVALKLVSRIPI